MKNEYNNVVFFPKRKKELEQKAFQAMRERDFEEALSYFKVLIDHGVDDKEIFLGELTTLIELGREQEAEELCEQLLEKKDENYWSYINIYATLLFQIHKHKSVAQLLEDVLNEEAIPEPFKNQFEKLYDVNQPLVDEQREQEAKITKRELIDAFDKEDHLAQWHLVNHLEDADITPYISLFEDMLKSEHVHPVIKTVIIGNLQSRSIEQSFKVIKFGLEMDIIPNQFPYMSDHPFRIRLAELMLNFEQENPTFYQLTEQIIDRFFNVIYPFAPELKALDLFKSAIVKIVKSSFDQQETNKSISDDLRTMINQIIEVEKIYFSIMDE